MDRAEVTDAVVAAIRDQTDNPDIDIDDLTTADDVPGWDSLAHVRIILDIGVRLKTRIAMSASYGAPNVGGLIDLAHAAANG